MSYSTDYSFHFITFASLIINTNMLKCVYLCVEPSENYSHLRSFDTSRFDQKVKYDISGQTK